MLEPAPVVDEFTVGQRFRVQWFDEVDSTNRLLIDAARAGSVTDGAVIVANHQRAGRGRLGRSWDDSSGAALLASVLVAPAGPAVAAHRITTAVAVALSDAVAACAGSRPQYKWPNDLVVGDRKLAGVLAEADVAADGTVRALVVGAGTNVASVPALHRNIAIACDEFAPQPVDRRALLIAWLEALEPLLGDLDSAVTGARADSATLGRWVRVERSDGFIEGFATELTADGALVVVADDGVTHVVAVGDVVHLRL